MLQQRCSYVLSNLVCFSKSKFKIFHFINNDILMFQKLWY